MRKRILTKQVGVVLSEEMHHRLIEITDNLEIPISQFIREIIEEKMGHERMYELTGIQFLYINTINQLISMKRDEDPSLEIAQDMLFIGDLLHYFLSGEICAEYTLATVSQLYNTTNLGWSDEIFEAFDIPKTLQTKIVAAGDKIGNIRADLAKEIGLSPQTAIVAPGIVSAIGMEIGRQSITSDDPAANTDARVVDVIIMLDEASSDLARRFTNLETVVRIDAGRTE